MCTCASCEYTDGFSGWRKEHARDGSFIPDNSGGFAAWPRGEPAGERSSNAAYAAHVRHVWAGAYKSVQFTPGQAAIAPRLPGLVMPVTYNAAAIRWNAGRGKVFVPAPEPVRVPTLLDLARQLRAERRAERQAMRKMRKAA